MHIAGLSLLRAEEKGRGWKNDLFVALTLSALAVEAMVNAVGDRVVPDWKDFESASPTAKARLLAERLNLSYDPTVAPWETVRWLAKLRNQIAHPKPEHVVGERIVSDSDPDDPVADRPESKIERQITLANARRAVAAVRDLLGLYCDAIPAEQRFGLYTDSWFTHMELHQ